MKKWIFVFSAFLAFNAHSANDWLDCGKDAKGNTANCQYKIDTDGTLTIQGVGNDGSIGYWYSDEHGLVQPWKNKGVTNVVIEDSIKDLGSFGFYNITSQSPIVIPSSVTNITSHAFDQANTPEVIIPDSVKVIGDSSLKSSFFQKINIPDSVKVIGNNAFRWSTSVTDIVFPDGVEQVVEGALSYCLNLKTLTIGENTQLGDLFRGYNYDNGATDIANLKIYCTGDTSKCDANLAAAGYSDLKSERATTKQINGVTYVYDSKGKLVTASGHRTEKRIYTLEEANQVAGKVNRVSIRYR